MMYSTNNKFLEYRIWALAMGLILLLGLVSVTGCGGGTVGSGDNDSVIAGRILTNTGHAFSGANITHAQTGASDITDEQGNFSIETNIEGQAPELFIDRDGVSSSIRLSDATAEQKTINIEITVNETTGIVDSVKVIATSVDLTPTPSVNTNYQQSLDGTVTGKNGKEIKGVKVQVHGSGTQVTSDAQGQFKLDVAAKTSSLQLDLTYNKLKGSVTLTGLPTDRNSRVEFVITLTVVSSQPDPGQPDVQHLDLDIKGIEVH